MRLLVPVLLIAFGTVSCADTGDRSEPGSSPTTTTTEQPLPTAAPDPGPLQMVSTAFDDGSEIPVRHTCDGADVSPRLEITGIPSSAATLALIVDDPDAPTGTWTHWVVYDIAADGPALTVPEQTGPGATEGLNSWNVTGYRGPCPPEGQRHRYIFEVSALDAELPITEGATSSELRTAMEAHILEQAELMGFYER